MTVAVVYLEEGLCIMGACLEVYLEMERGFLETPFQGRAGALREGPISLACTRVQALEKRC
jgi:hypothetical protein